MAATVHIMVNNHEAGGILGAKNLAVIVKESTMIFK